MLNIEAKEETKLFKKSVLFPIQFKKIIVGS